MQTCGAIDWKRIEGFVGFGSEKSPYIFLGMEEGLLSEATLDSDLAARSAYERYMDLYDAQAKLADTKKYFGEHPKNQPTWRPICDLMLRLTRNVAEPTKAQRLRYMADELGRRNGLTLLAELMPYPRKRADKTWWPYKRYGRYNDYGSYRKCVLPRRLALLTSVFAMPCQRKLIVAYGKSDWPDFKTLFQTTWTCAKPFEWGRVGETAILLAPQLATRAFNSENDLDHFADIAHLAMTQCRSNTSSRTSKPSHALKDMADFLCRRWEHIVRLWGPCRQPSYVTHFQSFSACIGDVVQRKQGAATCH
jgi:hypothetical protein